LVKITKMKKINNHMESQSIVIQMMVATVKRVIKKRRRRKIRRIKKTRKKRKTRRQKMIAKIKVKLLNHLIKKKRSRFLKKTSMMK